jgi:hypothetical protein
MALKCRFHSRHPYMDPRIPTETPFSDSRIYLCPLFTERMVNFEANEAGQPEQDPLIHTVSP